MLTELEENFCRKFCQKYRKSGFYEDMLQEAYVITLQARKLYDSTKSKYSTYLWRSLSNSLYRKRLKPLCPTGDYITNEYYYDNQDIDTQEILSMLSSEELDLINKTRKHFTDDITIYKYYQKKKKLAEKLSKLCGVNI